MVNAAFRAGGYEDTLRGRLLYFPTVALARAEPRLFAITTSVYIGGVGVFYASPTDDTTPDDGVHAFKVTAVSRGRFVAYPSSGSTFLIKFYTTCADVRADMANALSYAAIGVVNRGTFFRVAATARTDSMDEFTDYIGTSTGFELEMRAYNDYLSLAAEAPYREGRVSYFDGSLQLAGQYPGTSLSLGKEHWLDIVNDTNDVMPNGTPFYISGSQAQRLAVKPAVNGNGFASRTIGLTTHAIAAHQNGVGCVFGYVHEYNTAALTAGDMLYTHSVAGGMTTTVPPGHVDGAFLCYVMNTHPTDGTLFVRPSPLAKQVYETSGRPVNPRMGDMVFDGDLMKPIWWNFSAWVDATGAVV